MARLLLIAFQPHEGLQGAGFAQSFGMPFDVLNLTGEAPNDAGAERVLSANLAELPPADGLAKGLLAFAGGYSHVAAISSMLSKDVMARLAGLMDAAMVTDVIEADSPTVFKRPIVAGTVIATVEVLAEPVLLTVRPSGFAKPKVGGSSIVESVLIETASMAKRVSVVARAGTRPDLTRARVVVSGGRPLKDAETFESVIGGLADQLGGAVGATRAAVDNGIVPNELQVGQTGKIVAPDLYIAAGISGSTQHMAGIKDSKVIVAINKDPDAPIFEGADFGLVADLFDAIPELRAKLGTGE
ncbi:MAG TPA: FAD-binding protein [Fimbriimonadaceae bacterium]|nr:FAD-binding protein [Fimbriimonadaceae bacterium]